MQITNFKKENQQLKDDLKIEYRENLLHNKTLNLQMESIQTQGSQYAQKLETETLRNVIKIGGLIKSWS